MIRFDLRLHRGSFRLQAQAELAGSGVTVITGPSGCGKTSLLRCIAGLERGVQGRLQVGEECWQSDRLFRPPHRRPVGYVFQEARLFPHLSVKRNLEYAWKRLPKNQRDPPPTQVADWLGITHLLGRRPLHLSGGEQQRVAIGRALLSRPRLLLMDEPMASLDQAGKRDILPYLERLHRQLEIPVLYVSHSPDEITRVADQLLWMEAGRCLESGPLQQMYGRLDLPLAHDVGACALLEGQVLDHDEAFALTRLQTPAGTLIVPNHQAPTGTPVRVNIAARDVSLALQPPTDSSILNILPVTVVAIADDNPAQVLVKLEAGGATLLSRITRRSCHTLGLAAGLRLYAQVKSVALVR